MGFVGKMLGNIENIQIYYIIGLLIFIGLFITILVRTLRMKKSDIIAIKTSIIDEGEALESIHS
jgi:hypothetical protein